MSNEVKRFENVFDGITRNCNAIERIMSNLYSKNTEDPIINELGNIYFQNLLVQKDFSRTYGDQLSVDYVDRKINDMKQNFNVDNIQLEDNYTKLNSEDIYESMNKTYNSIKRVMSDIYFNSPKNIVILEIGQQVALGYLEMQKSFVEGFLPRDSRDIALDNIENKRITMANELSDYMILKSASHTKK